jgi:hypothetical protein
LGVRLDSFSRNGPPEMLMELAYRLAVEDSPFIQYSQERYLSDHPIVEVDGHDRVVDSEL